MLDLGMLVSAIFHDVRIVYSAIATGFGTFVMIVKNVSAFIQEQSLEKKLKDEQAHAVELIDFLKVLQGVEGEQSSAACLQLQISLQLTLKKLSDLTKEAAEAQKRNLNQDLSLLQRLFLLFRPAGFRESMIHGFACFFMLGGPLLIAFLGFLWNRGIIHDNDTVADVIVLVGYGALVLRKWALAERNWRRGVNATPGQFGKIFLLEKPVNTQMRAAQIFMWVCVFWLMESLEDVIFHTLGQRGFDKESLFSLLLALAGAVICRTWAAEESKAGDSGNWDTWELPFHPSLQSTTEIWLIRTVYCSAAVLPLPLLFQSFGRDFFDVTGASVVWLFSWYAGTQWLDLMMRRAKPTHPAEAGLDHREISSESLQDITNLMKVFR